MCRSTQIIIILDCCYAEDARTPKDHYLETLRQRINVYFEVPGTESGQRQGVLRVVLAASRYDEVAREQDGHGIMTNLLLKVLNGEIDEALDDKGQIKISRLIDYIKEKMPADQTPSVTLSDAQSRDCILARYPARAEELRRLRGSGTVNPVPHSYIAKRPRDNYQAIAGAFEEIDGHLFETGTVKDVDGPRTVGLIGMGGIGKTRFALELAHRYAQEQRFPGGVFWLPAAGMNRLEFQRRLAELASQTDYLPAGDDPARAENETRRARHITRYLASHADALCVLDNVDELDFILDNLTELAGQPLTCTFLYTSRNRIVPPGVKPYFLLKLAEASALRLLLWRRSDHSKPLPEDQARAAREICRYVDYLPLPLTLLGDLLQDQQLTVQHLLDVLKERGTLGIVYSPDTTKNMLFLTVELSWEKLRHNPDAQRLFKLMVFFPNASPIPLWLAGIASGLGEAGNTRLEPLGRARFELEKWSLVEPVSETEIRVHSWIREFGQRLVLQTPAEEQPLVRADENVLAVFANINLLAQRIQREGFWKCLSQVQEVATYARLLALPHANLFGRIERWLALDSSRLTSTRLEPETLGRLLWQQLSNRAIEEGLTLSGVEPAGLWLKQLKPAGAENRALLHELNFFNPVEKDEELLAANYLLDGTSLVTMAHGEIFTCVISAHKIRALLLKRQEA